VGTEDNSAAVEEANFALKDAQWAEQAGLPERAVAAYRKVSSLFPGVWEVHNNLASLLLDLRRPGEALQSAQAALALRPDDPLVNANVARAWLQLDKPEEAIPFLRRALQGNPATHHLREMLACALLDTGRPDEGAAVFREAEARFADDFQLFEMMAKFYQRARMVMDAERSLLRMRQMNPRHMLTYGELAALYMDCAQFSKANAVARDGLRMDPDSVVFWNALANSQASVGQVDEALKSYRKVLELSPGFAPAHSNMLLSMHWVSSISPEEIFAEHQNFGRMYAPPSIANHSFANTPDPGRRIRIGYLSPDIRKHSVAFFLEPLLDFRDRERFEVYGYGAVKTPDEVTRRLRAKFDRYRSVDDMPVPQLAALIQGDELDILIDLAGHAGNLQIAVMGFKPAPVQVTYLGYPDTTGIAAVDYRITDWISDPPGAEARHAEQLVRLPNGFHSFRPPDDPPGIGEPPCLARGYVTFGSFNREFKVSPTIMDLWCRILLAVPGSRILMKSIAGADPATREFQLGEFERRGVSRDRVQLVGFISSQAEHLAMYRDVDIALDTFPYHGTTTTLDSLLMGVPVITLEGRIHAGRVGASLLTQVGLTENIARTEDEYVSKAVELAADPQRIASLHGSLRQRLLTSPLCDGQGFSRNYEYALRGMWLNWCRAQGVSLPAELEAQAAFDYPGPVNRHFPNESTGPKIA
jgi:predicted O-linked N-acetylglucosamine transferase (SPINDLY family)